MMRLFKTSIASVAVTLAGCATQAPKPTPVPAPAIEPVVEILPEAPPPIVEPDNRTLSVIGVGDIMLGTDFPLNHLPDDDGVSFLEGVTETLQDADVTFGNLEQVLMDGGEPVKECKDPSACYLFRSPTRYAAHLKEAGFDVMSVANNHARDFGEEGRDSSMAALDAVGIHHSGREGTYASWIAGDGLRVALMAFAPFKESNSPLALDRDKATAAIASLAENHDIVIVSLHGGAEGVDVANIPFEEEYYRGELRGDVVAFARAMVDAGADLVIGHGPHVPRAMEIYQDRLIAYSLGNFATYYGISVAGIKGVAPILKANLRADGSLIDGEIVSAVQLRPGGPYLDKRNRAYNEIVRLTLEDFSGGGLLFQPGGGFQPDPEPPRQIAADLESRADTYLERYLVSHDFSGVVSIGSSDGTVLRKAYGMADFEAARPLDTDSVFAIASLTKTFTAATILVLKDRGLVSLDDPLSRYWNGHPRGDDITIRQLLVHQGGIAPEHTYPGYQQRIQEAMSLAELADWIASVPLAYEPGTDGGYSNFGYTLLAYIAELAAEKPYAQLLRDDVLVPTGMSSTEPNSLHNTPAAMAVGYMPGPAPLWLERAAHENAATAVGSGDLRSTIDDMAAWGRTMLAGDLINISDEPYPYGWGRREYFERQAIEQTGIIGGYMSGLLLFPDDDLYVAYLGNVRNGRYFKNLQIDLAAMALGEPYSLPNVSVYGSSAIALDQYSGRYEFPGLGIIKIESDSDSRMLTYTWESFGLSSYLLGSGIGPFYSRLDDVEIAFSSDALIWNPGRDQIVAPRVSGSMQQRQMPPH